MDIRRGRIVSVRAGAGRPRSVGGRVLARISDEDAERAWPAGDVVERSSALMPPTRATTSLILATSDDLDFLSTLADHPAVAPFLAVGSGDEGVLRGLLSDRGFGPRAASPVCGRLGRGRAGVGGLAVSVVDA